MDLRFVESLVAVAELGTMAAAARQQGITPAAVAQRVAALEAELQISLLVRDGRRMALTPDGYSLLPDLRAMLQIQAGLRARLTMDHLNGALRLGAISTAIGEFAPELITYLKQEAPGVDLHLTPGASAELFAEFEAGKLDAVLMVSPPFTLAKTMDFTVLRAQELGVLCPKIRDDELPFILYSRQSWGGMACWNALKRMAPQPRLLCEMDAVESIAQMVQEGLGQAVLPRWSGLDRHYPQTLFTPIDAPAREVGLLSWRRDRERPVLQLLHRALGV